MDVALRIQIEAVATGDAAQESAQGSVDQTDELARALVVVEQLLGQLAQLRFVAGCTFGQRSKA